MQATTKTTGKSSDLKYSLVSMVAFGSQSIRKIKKKRR